ncbi:uncharacterized protein LOC103316058 isoform X1 [Nasonia vitripennis]|uniref:DUF4776 domain-containing protein n=1 Tax=Nasonia vitripennis TaxID=7425 RepID=A0A7M7H9Q3_NASVI|nr:uncharacterized protein LOC103316058 isoform X1 [Nasonia vitripennis]
MNKINENNFANEKKEKLKQSQKTRLSRNQPSTHSEQFSIILKAPTRLPRIAMASSDFERQLTSAQKLNDHNYRGLVYRAYPNEPTCACPQIASGKKTTKKKQQQQHSSFSGCRSGCTSRCCSSVRQRKDANDSGTSPAHFMPIHCAPSTKNDEVYSGVACNSKEQRIRMRGGGSGEQLGFFNGGSDFTWYNGGFMPALRLEGGGGGETYPAAGCGKAKVRGMQRFNTFENNQDFFQWDRINPGFMAANKCQLRNNEDKSNKPLCSCPDKSHLEAVLKKKGHGVCIKKPCLGTDCLIKAFQDAQDFVDSIGKVPGLAGLGIIESPYFGQSKEVKEVKKAESKLGPTNKHAETTSNLCNTQNLENLKMLNYNKSLAAHTPNLPKKSGVVQEGIVAIPDPLVHASLKPKKKDEKIEKPKETESSTSPIQNFEDTPCGEPKCKSKPKKVVAEEANSDSAEKIDAIRDKVSAPQKADKKHSPKMRSHSGLSGDRTRNSKSTPRLSKSAKANQFIYSFGNSYPTSVYGHKNCSLLRTRVPAHMGWMWNQTDTVGKLKLRAGWRPGAISVHLRDILREAKEGFLKETRRPRSAPSKSRKGKAQKTMSYTSIKKTLIANEEETEEEDNFPPTLHIHRKDGVYYVTMYPIRPEASEVPRIDEPVNPLQFKIVKSKDSLASSSTASDMEIEFTPPAAVNRLKKKPNVIHIETQVKQQEILDAFKKTADFKKKNKDSKTKKDKVKKK